MDVLLLNKDVVILVNNGLDRLIRSIPSNDDTLKVNPTQGSEIWIFSSLFMDAAAGWKGRRLEKGPYNTAAGIKKGWGDFKIDVGSLQVLHGW